MGFNSGFKGLTSSSNEDKQTNGKQSGQNLQESVEESQGRKEPVAVCEAWQQSTDGVQHKWS